MSVFGCDLFWIEDPLPTPYSVKRTKHMSYDDWRSTEPDPEPLSNAPKTTRTPKSAARCERCSEPAYGSFPDHVFCRQHFAEHQRMLIEEICAKVRKGAA